MVRSLGLREENLEVATWVHTHKLTLMKCLYHGSSQGIWGAPGVDQTKGRCPTEELEAPEYKRLQPYQ
jgi:hypothetical protein